jgi:thiamine biosynthesis protein ThiS
MIRINDDKIKWRDGMTVRDAMNEMRFTFPLVVVSVNGVIIPPDELDSHLLKDGDEVMVLHLTSGG